MNTRWLYIIVGFVFFTASYKSYKYKEFTGKAGKVILGSNSLLFAFVFLVLGIFFIYVAIKMVGNR